MTARRAVGAAKEDIGTGAVDATSVCSDGVRFGRCDVNFTCLFLLLFFKRPENCSLHPPGRVEHAGEP